MPKRRPSFWTLDQATTSSEGSLHTAAARGLLSRTLP